MRDGNLMMECVGGQRVVVLRILISFPNITDGYTPVWSEDQMAQRVQAKIRNNPHLGTYFKLAEGISGRSKVSRKEALKPTLEM